ncbi:MAG TPA: LytTR family DNA-binding domain-containing protein [Rhodothermales bacterium]
MSRLRVLIADDELLARKRLEDLLADEENVEILAAVDDGKAAVDAIRELRPDLVFLDVQMPGLTGIEVVNEVGPENMPVTVFVTAYDQYLLRAFELEALDYLLKPFDDERFEQAFARARKMVRLKEAHQLTERLRALLRRESSDDEGLAPRPAGSGGWLERVAVESRGQVHVIPVNRIAYITSSGPYAELHVGEKTYLIREKMQTLEERLDPERFFRIHRSSIVRLDSVEAILNRGGGDYAVRLSSGEKLSLSRNRREELEQRLGLDMLRSHTSGEE